MSKTSNKQRLEVLHSWISWVSKQKSYSKSKQKVKRNLED